ncbi:7621_t:CDS:2, partial [Gigaspora rosea]
QFSQEPTKKCVVKVCRQVPALKWKKITDNVLTKAEANGTLASYYKDHKNEYMCLNCYNAIVVNGASAYVEHAAEWARGLKRRRNDNISISEFISLLTNIIFEREIIDNDLPIVTFSQLKLIAEDKNNQLSFFFNEIEEMACLEKKPEAERRALERSLAYQCYLMCWNQCMAIPLWNLKDESTANEDNLSWLRREMVAKDFRLSSFFDSIYNASLPENRSSKYLDKLDKKLAVECYVICGNQNAKLTAFKKDISLFVDLMGVSTEAIDALSYAGITISRRHLDREKSAIADNHPHKTSSCDTPQQLFKTAKVVDARKTLSRFEDIFVVQKKSTYADNDHLALLTKKAEVFLLETFGNVYRKLGQSSIIKGRNEKITCKLASLDFTVDKKQMPLGFSSEHLPAYDKCDYYHKLLHDGTGKSSMVITCGHRYYESCFTISLNKKCLYCENVLKLGIRNNVSSLLLRLRKLNTKKSNLKEFIDADDDSSQDQKISDEDNILEVLRKDKQALPRVEQAYSMALERFLNI